jgi:hypothetical protein
MVAVLFCLGQLVGLGSLGLAQAQSSSGSDYTPTVGQPGKDVVWVPTPEDLVERMLQMAQVGARDVVMDLGSGDGRIAIAASKRAAKAVGIEFNPDMVNLSRRNNTRDSGKAEFINGDVFKTDFSSATVLTMYLLPQLNMRLRPTILDMKPGTRIVSHAFDMGEWEADDKVSHEYAHAFLWVVPSDVQGTWTLKEVDSQAEVTLEIEQVFQRIGGSITERGRKTPLLGAQLRGDKIAFQYMGADQQLRSVTAQVNGNRMNGVTSLQGGQLPVEAIRR